MIELAFWSSVFLVLYAYIGYPCALMALSLVRQRPVARAPIAPCVSFIITAHNEAARIREKIDNTLAQDYPPDQLEIIVASDCSTDGTDDIVRSFSDRVRLVRAPVAARQGGGAAACRRERLRRHPGVFRCRDRRLRPHAVSTIVMNFADSDGRVRQQHRSLRQCRR